MFSEDDLAGSRGLLAGAGATGVGIVAAGGGAWGRSHDDSFVFGL